MDTSNDCPICFESLIDKTVGSPDNCDHKFCLPCIEKWSKHENFCPVDRLRFKKIISGDVVIQIKPKRRRKKASPLYDISVSCEICKDFKEENDTVILCDSCDLGFHFVCLKPPLKSAPRGNWYCPDCQKVSRNLKAQKTQNEDKVPMFSGENLFNQPLNSTTKQTANHSRNTGQSTNEKFTETKYNHVKKAKKDCYQKNLLCAETRNGELNKTWKFEFEDFFRICDDDCVLTNRKPLNTEMQPLRQLRVKRKNLNTHTTHQTRKTQRLAAATGRIKMLTTESYTEDSSSSSVGYSFVEKDSLENAATNFTDIKKTLSQLNSSSSGSESNTVSSESVPECSESNTENTAMENLSEESYSSRECENLGMSTFVKKSDHVTEAVNRTESLSVFENPSFESFSASTKINNSTEVSSNEEMPVIANSFCVFEESAIEEPPELVLEPLNLSKIPGHKIPPKLTPEPLNLVKTPAHKIPPELVFEALNTDKIPGNETPPIMKVTEIDNPFVVEECIHIDNASTSEAIDLSDRITDNCYFTQDNTSMTMMNDGEIHCPMMDCQIVENSKDDGLSQEIDNFPDAAENLIDNFHVRQVHYAIKAKMNLPAELQKIERETWLSHKSKSSRKLKYKSHKKAEIHISSSSHHVVSGNAEFCNFFKDTQLGGSKSTQNKMDFTECNNLLNPFYTSISSSCPKKRFKVTEYALQPSDKQASFNKVPKDVLRSFMGPDALKHLDIHEDGSLFLNWFKSNSP